MELPSIQTKEFKALAAKSSSLGSSQQLVKLVSTVFSHVDMLRSSFRIGSIHKDVGVDVRGLMEFYSEFPKVTKDGKVLLKSLDSVLERLKGQAQVKALLKSQQQLRALFIAMLYPGFYEFQNSFQLIRLAHVLHFVPNDMRKILVKWLIQLSAEELMRMVENLQTVLSVQLLKLLPDSGEDDLQSVQHYILIYCRLLQLLFLTNQKHKRIALDNFQNAQLTEHIDPLTQVKLTMRKVARLNFVRFPFLFDLDYKTKLLEYESKLEQMINLQKGIHSLQNGFIPPADSHGNLTVDSVLYLHFEINRQCILDDSVTKLAQPKRGMKKPLKISFIGQEGHDEGGVKKQYFQLVTKQIFNPNLAMFVPRNDSRYFWFNGDSLQAPIIFEFVGMLLGLSIYNSILLDLHFPLLLYKKLLEDENSPPIDYFKQLADIEPTVHKSLQQILDTKDSLAGLDLYFQVSSDCYGVRKVHDLKPDGAHIPVTHHNKKQYVELYSQWLLNKHIKKQFDSFKKGFYRVVTGCMIKVLFPQELQKVICGQETFDFHALQKGTEYEGFTQKSPVIVQLWEILHAMSLQDKKAFLFFVTGSDRAPIKGLGQIGMLVQRQSPDTQNLPTAHTCTNVFLLPQYSSKAKLQKKLALALKNNHGFGLI